MKSLARPEITCKLGYLVLYIFKLKRGSKLIYKTILLEIVLVVTCMYIYLSILSTFVPI